jgi:hypothetical protein
MLRARRPTTRRRSQDRTEHRECSGKQSGDSNAQRAYDPSDGLSIRLSRGIVERNATAPQHLDGFDPRRSIDDCFKGEIYLARRLCFKRRETIGKTQPNAFLRCTGDDAYRANSTVSARTSATG